MSNKNKSFDVNASLKTLLTELRNSEHGLAVKDVSDDFLISILLSGYEAGVNDTSAAIQKDLNELRRASDIREERVKSLEDSVDGVVDVSHPVH